MDLYDLRYLFYKLMFQGKKRRHSFPIGSKYYSNGNVKWIATPLVAEV